MTTAATRAWRIATGAAIAAATLAAATPRPVWPQVPPVSPAPTQRFEYDAAGRLTLQRNAPGSATPVWQHRYDSLGRRIQSTDAQGGITAYQHDAADGLRRVTDPRGLVTSYARDSFGNVLALASPDTGVTHQRLDAAGNLLWRQSAGGSMASFTYDALNRLTSADHRHPSKPARAYQWTYDQTGAAFGAGIGRLTSITYPEFGHGGGPASASTVFGYSAEGWPMWQQQRPAGSASALTVAYARSAVGTVTGITYPSGMRVLLDLDGTGRPSALLVAVSAAASPVPLLTQITHRPFADQDSEAPGWIWNTAQGQQVHPRIYDTAGRMIGYRLGPLLRELQHDAADRITAYRHRDFVTQASMPAAQRVFSYDPTDRLQGGTFSDGVNFALGFDRNGNRTGRLQYRPITPSSASLENNISSLVRWSSAIISPVNNQLLEASMPSARYRYDAEGNLSSDSRLGLVLVHAADGRLASATRTTTGQTAYYSYDNFGQRTRKALPNGEQRLYVHGERGELLGEYSATLAPVREYIWLGPTPVAMVQGGAIYTIHADHLGTPRVVLDTWGRQRWTWLSDPFGETPPVTNPQNLGAFDLPLRHPGQYADAETGYWYNWHRYYDPTVGRYIQSDPIGLAAGINTYAYVENNPLSYTDPKGLIKLHGNWCGPDWTGGFTKSYDKLSDAERKAALPPVTKLDGCCQTHDIVYAVCRSAHPCDATARQKCFEEADRDLSSCASRSGSGYGANLLLFGNPQKRVRDYMRDSSPRSEDDAKDCSCPK